jgi:hypothetical protein
VILLTSQYRTTVFVGDLALSKGRDDVVRAISMSNNCQAMHTIRQHGNAPPQWQWRSTVSSLGQHYNFGHAHTDCDAMGTTGKVSTPLTQQLAAHNNRAHNTTHTTALVAMHQPSANATSAPKESGITINHIGAQINMRVTFDSPSSTDFGVFCFSRQEKKKVYPWITLSVLSVCSL